LSGFWLIATPYTKYPYGHERAFELAVAARAAFTRAAIPSFSPIIHSHHVAYRHGIDPTDVNLWLAVEAPIREMAAGMLFVEGAGHSDSTGMAHEEREFNDAKKPVYHVGVIDNAQGDQQFYFDPAEILALMSAYFPKARRAPSPPFGPDGRLLRQRYYGDGRKQPLDHIHEAGWGPAFAASNVLKYLDRQKGQSDLDRDKARWYLADLREGAGASTEEADAVLHKLAAILGPDRMADLDRR
jgi:hypothetical protein